MGLGPVDVAAVQVDLGEEGPAPDRDPEPVDPVQIAEGGLRGRGGVVERACAQGAERTDRVVARHGPAAASAERDLPTSAGGRGDLLEPVCLQVDQAGDEPRLEDVGLGGVWQLGPGRDVPSPVEGLGEAVGEQVEEAQHGVAGDLGDEVAVSRPAVHGSGGRLPRAGVVECHEAGEGQLPVNPGPGRPRLDDGGAALHLGDAR